MATDDRKSAFRGGTGGTSGTGQPDATPDTSDRTRDSSAAANVSAGADRLAGSGASVARSGRTTSEGTGESLPNPPGGGDPGGMGGTATNRERPHDRPPGGSSPVESGKEPSRG